MDGGDRTMKLYDVGVDVTVSTWVSVKAENKQEAKEKAKAQAESKINTSEVIIHTEVHNIEEV